MSVLFGYHAAVAPTKSRTIGGAGLSPADRVRLMGLMMAWGAFVLAVYCPDIGRGFVKDDFTWIRAARLAMEAPSELVIPQQPGFYRPVVTASFALDHLVHRWQPRGYGWTNLALYAACAIAIACLGMSLGLSKWAAIIAAFMWAINPHGINMALVWLSGRTALLLTLFSVSASVAFLRRSYLCASVLIVGALASKEEAVLLPIVLSAWTWRDGDRRDRLAALSAVLVPLLLYAAVRSVTPAFTPWTAPSFYQFTAAPTHLLRNLGEYLDRSTTFVAICVLIGWGVYRVRPAIDENTRRVLTMCAIWWAGMFAITMWLPVRSSLYAVCPSVASALAGAAVLGRMHSRARERQVWQVELVLAMALLAAIPIYRARNHRWVEGARISQRTLATIRADAPGLPATGTILLHDEADNGSTFRSAFGDLASEAVQTAFGRSWTARIDTTTERGRDGQDVIADYQLQRGRIARIAARDR
jgi:hypothetical protein